MGASVKKVKGLRNTNWWLQNSHRDVKFSIRDIDNNIVTIYGARWVHGLLKGSFYKLYNCPTTMLYT